MGEKLTTSFPLEVHCHCKLALSHIVPLFLALVLYDKFPCTDLALGEPCGFLGWRMDPRALGITSVLPQRYRELNPSQDKEEDDSF